MSIMRKWLSVFLLLCFILWILPLGIFIKPSLQKLACDGQRAFCMCHIMMPKASDKAMEPGVSIKAGSSANKENSSGGAGNDFVSAKLMVVLNLKFADPFENRYLTYKNPYFLPLESVPKI